MSQDVHDPNTCYSCITKRILEDTQDKKFDHVIVVTTNKEGFHSSMNGDPETLEYHQRIRLVENLAYLLKLEEDFVVLFAPKEKLSGYRALK